MIRIFIAFLLFLPLPVFAESLIEQEENLLGKEVVKISFQHDSGLSRESLLETLPLSVGDRVEAGILVESVQALYERGVFEEVNMWPKVLSEEEVEILFFLIPREVVTNIKFHGQKALTKRELGRVVGLRTGEALDKDFLEVALRKLQERYKQAGFYNSSIEADVLRQGGTPFVSLIFRIREGYDSEISDIRFRGEVPTDVSERIERVVGFSSGLHT